MMSIDVSRPHLAFTHLVQTSYELAPLHLHMGCGRGKFDARGKKVGSMHGAKMEGFTFPENGSSSSCFAQHIFLRGRPKKLFEGNMCQYMVISPFLSTILELFLPWYIHLSNLLWRGKASTRRRRVIKMCDALSKLARNALLIWLFDL